MISLQKELKCVYVRKSDKLNSRLNKIKKMNVFDLLYVANFVLFAVLTSRTTRHYRREERAQNALRFVGCILVHFSGLYLIEGVSASAFSYLTFDQRLVLSSALILPIIYRPLSMIDLCVTILLIFAVLLLITSTVALCLLNIGF